MQLGDSLARRRRRRRRGGGDDGDGGNDDQEGWGDEWSNGPRRRRRTDPVLPIAGLLPFLGLAALGGLVGYFLATLVFFPAAPPPRDVEEVPGLIGMNSDEAREAVSAAGLALGDIQYLRHPRVDSGAVMGQSPLPGQLATPGDSVGVTLSLGPERRSIPPVRQLRGDRAVALLAATGFGVEVDSVENDAPRGSVLETDPAEGTEVPLPSDVRVLVSLGPPAVFMPDLLQMMEEEARDTLGVLGLEVEEVEEVFRFGRDQGRVVSQDPAAGAEMERGASVRLVVGRRGGERDPS
ncbi:MAG TPA: PASTA domain-containing protein [Longimicrobiales bacterium]|nr:PASTA domain-containing protein [Longimicrobiales bacterium]